MIQEKRERILCLALLCEIQKNAPKNDAEKTTASIIVPKNSPPILLAMYHQAKKWDPYTKNTWYEPYGETENSFIMTNKRKLPHYYNWMHKYGRLHLEYIMRYFYTPQFLTALYHTSTPVDIDDTTLKLETRHFSKENAEFIAEKFNWLFPNILLSGDETGFIIRNKRAFLEILSTYHFSTKTKADIETPSKSTKYKEKIKKKKIRQRARRAERREYFGEKEKERRDYQRKKKASIS